MRRAAGASRSGAAVGLIAVGLIAAACSGPGAGTPRPTDPHVILAAAVRATAALPSARFHAEISSSMGAPAGGGGFGPSKANITFDADVDLATRQLTGREQMAIQQNAPNAIPVPAQAQGVEVIVASTSTFIRQAGQARWSKVGGGITFAPTNAEAGQLLLNLLADPSVTVDKADEVSCTLGTCDHLIVHLPGDAVGNVLGILSGMPANGAAGFVPDIDLDLRIDQASSVIAEVRTVIAVQGSSTELLLALSNPGAPVQITAPPPGLVDDMGLGGGQVTTILETVGSEIESPMTIGPEESPPAP